MTSSELYKKIKTTSYIKSGDEVDWKVEADNKERIVYLLFQETRSKRDWQVNFNFPAKIYKKQTSCITVAQGWGNAYKSCNDEIMKSLIDMANIHPDYKVLICGWSYGGAMAIIASEDFFYRTKRKADVITFGAPKALFGIKTYKYLKSCTNEVKQYAHINDVVPLVPPFIGYFHLNKISIGKDFFLTKLFDPEKYHCIYGDETLYNMEKSASAR